MLPPEATGELPEVDGEPAELDGEPPFAAPAVAFEVCELALQARSAEQQPNIHMPPAARDLLPEVRRDAIEE